MQKCYQFHGQEKWWTLRKTGSYWAEEYATSQPHRSSRAEVNKFLLAYVIIIVFKCVYFRQYFACLCERIYCCNVIMLSWSWSSRSNSSGYLRDYRPQGTPFLVRFLWWHNQRAVRVRGLWSNPLEVWNLKTGNNPYSWLGGNVRRKYI